MQKIWLWCITIFLWENELEIQIVRPSTHLFPAIPSVVAFGVFSSFLLLTFHMVGARFLTQLTVTVSGLGSLKRVMETLRWQARSSQVFGVGSFWVFFVIEKSLDLRYLVSGWHSHQTFLFLPFQELICISLFVATDSYSQSQLLVMFIYPFLSFLLLIPRRRRGG